MTASTLEVGDNVVAFLLSVSRAVWLILGPSIAALAMSGRSALVAVKALLLKRTRLTGIGPRSAPAVGDCPSTAEISPAEPGQAQPVIA